MLYLNFTTFTNAKLTKEANVGPSHTVVYIQTVDFRD